MDRSILKRDWDVRFGRRAKMAGGIAVPVLAGADVETLFAGARGLGPAGAFELFEAGDWLLGVASSDAPTDLATRTEQLYRDMSAAAAAHGRKLARIWNYVPAINAPSPSLAEAGLENYRVFCRARARAFERAPASLSALASPPAASAVGAEAGALAVVFAAARERTREWENPEQVPAYRYPPDYGPRAPAFSRASQVLANGQRWTFVSGTAAIKGHASVAEGDFSGQLACTLDNLRVMFKVCGLDANGRGERHFKVYLRHAEDLAAARAALASAGFRADDQIAWLRADICREELLVEIEATVVD